MIPFKVILMIFIIILLIVLLTRKFNGQKGTWDSKEDIQEYALIMSEPGDSGYKLVGNLKKPEKNTDGSRVTESLGEQICRNHLNKRLGKEFIKDRPEFLKNPITNTNLELDCFCKEIKLALEYNGKQHYEYVPKFHKTKTDFYNQKYRDEIKKRLCYKNGVDLIEVPYYIPSHEIPLYIDRALEKLGRLKLV